MNMRRWQCMGLAAALCFLSHESAVGQESETWVTLFNGQDLEGWTPKFAGYELGENLHNTFRVEDGVLQVSYDDWGDFRGEFGHLFYKEPYSHYRVRMEYRFVGDQVSRGPGWALRNNGIMLHCQAPESMAKDQNFPVSIEVQLLGGNGRDRRPTANLCTPGTNVMMDGRLVTQHCTQSDSDTFHGDQWVTAEVEVRGGEVIRHFVNGEQVMEYNEPQYDPRDADAQKLLTGDDKIITSGYISLQAESHPTEFRKIELLVLEE